MKLNCGLTPETNILRTKEWHDWFAWRPVQVADNDCRWFETVQRRRMLVDNMCYDTKYRAKK